MGCLIALVALLSPRFALILVWIFGNSVEHAYHDSFLVPFFGMLFLPATTLIYALTWSLGGLQGFDFLWLMLAILYDAGSWGLGARGRRS